jgi:DNA-binding NarL/FixJ family response regulator
MENEEKQYQELVRIRSLLEILTGEKLKEKLESVATTRERQIIWASCDGMTSTEEIARKTGISQRAVQVFVKELLEKDLLDMGKRGYPKRRFEIIPPSWRIEHYARTVE